MKTDPVLAQRARIAKRVKLAKRIGYSGLLIAIVVFGIEIITGFTAALSTVAVVGLAVGIVVLPLPIVLGYGIMAADREDRGGGSFH